MGEKRKLGGEMKLGIRNEELGMVDSPRIDRRAMVNFLFGAGG